LEWIRAIWLSLGQSADQRWQACNHQPDRFLSDEELLWRPQLDEHQPILEGEMIHTLDADRAEQMPLRQISCLAVIMRRWRPEPALQQT
jgi:hypothetical protein